MSLSTEQPGISLVFSDHDQNYYVIPVEIFERGRVPAERKAEVEEALREHEVTGHGVPLLLGVAAAGVSLGVIGMTGATMIALGTGMAAGAAYNHLTKSETPVGGGDTPTVVREG